MSDVLKSLEDFLLLSKAMADAAESEEWDKVVQLQHQRDEQSAESQNASISALPREERAQGRSVIEQCLDLDRRTRRLIEERQESLRVLLREGPAK